MSDERTTMEADAIERFVSGYFPEEFVAAGLDSLSPDERTAVEYLLERADHQFDSSKGTLGLALDFLLVAEGLSALDGRLNEFEPELTQQDIFERYEKADRGATLTLKYGDEQFGIRPVHNEVIDLFREELGRTNFPSSPGHHTGEWSRYQEMLETAFRLSRHGRYEAVQRLFDLGLRRLDSKQFESREPPFPEPFRRVLLDYDREHPDEQAGSAYQAMAYGYVRAEWPHLSVEASKLRTGSSRQHRYGDVDGFLGPDLLVSVEAKDKRIDDSNVRHELGTMMQLAENTTGISVAMCRAVDNAARELLNEAGVRVVSDESLERQLNRWDYHKQNRAVQGMLHFLTNVEENPKATQRLLAFLDEVDPYNTSLVHLNR